MLQLSLSVSLNAPASAVFSAFALPEKLVSWFAPGDAFVTQVMSSFQEGGKYSLVMQDPSGEQYQLIGEYLTIEQDAHLRFSWAWADNREETLITEVDVVFVEQENQTTQMILTHAGFANEAERDQHQQGWIACLQKLSMLFLSDAA
jgi:uncharacterized protein YndB with AHSA1/START domain